MSSNWRRYEVLLPTQFNDGRDVPKLVVDVPDSDDSRGWMRQFKARWMSRLDQLDLWVVSFTIEVD